MSDNLNEFMLEYLKSVRNISKIVTQMMDNEIQCYENKVFEDSFNFIICWEVTENIKRLIGLYTDSKPYNLVIRESTDPDLSISTISTALYQNKLVIIKYESIQNEEEEFDYSEHFISCIGSNGLVYLIQFLPNDCITSETLSIDDFLQKMYLIMIGEEPDWFNGIREKLQLSIEIYDRKLLNSNRISEFLTKYQVLLNTMNSRIKSSGINTNLIEHTIPVIGSNPPKFLPRPSQQLLSLQPLLSYPSCPLPPPLPRLSLPPLGPPSNKWDLPPPPQY